MADTTAPPKYPDIVVNVTEKRDDGTVILARVLASLRAAGVSRSECDAFFAQAMGGDHDHMLRTCKAWVTVDERKE